MGTVGEDLLPDLLEPHSPGVTSILRQCFGDDGCFEEINSASSETFCTPQPQNVAANAVFETLLPSGNISSHQQMPCSSYSMHETKGADSAGPSGGSLTQRTGQPLGFNLGTHPHQSCLHFQVSLGRRRRGRKPLPKASDLQEQLLELTEQLQLLTKENVFLRNKLKVLERVVPHRDESVGYLSQLLSSASAQAVATAAAGARVVSPGDGDVAASADPSPCSSPSREQSPSASGENTSSCSGQGQGVGSTGEAQSSQPRGSLAVSSGTNSVGRGPGSAVAALDKAGRNSGVGKLPTSAGSVVLSLCPSPDGTVPEIALAAVEELKRISPVDFRQLWKHVCMQLGVLVSGAEVHGPGSSPYVRLERFLERALAYMDKLTLLSPACFVQSMYMNVETGQPERPNDNFWIACARSLNLTPQQLAEVHSLASVYEQNVVPVVQQRLHLAMQLSTRLAAVTSQPSTSGDALTALSSVDELAEQLERNVLKEHQTHWNIGDFLCSSVLTPLQIAKALTGSYPYIPDGVAIMHAFKVLGSTDSAEGAQRPPGSSQPELQSAHQFPSLAALLAGHLPALAGLVTGGGTAAAAPRAGGPAAQTGALGAAGLSLAGLAGLTSGLQPAQLQALMSRLQPGQLQALLAARQGSQPLPQASLVAALQACLMRTGQQGVPAAAATMQPSPTAVVNPQLQLLALLMGTGAGGQCGVGGVAASGQHVTMR